MKIMKFRKHLSVHILAGTKIVTWRLFDDKDLSEGDIVSFVIWETGREFARAKLKSVIQKPLGQLEENDWQGHERYSDSEEMYRTFATYYGQMVNSCTMVKIITFEIL